MRKNLYIIVLLAISMLFPINAQVTGLSDVRLYIDQGHSRTENMGIHGYSESENVLRVGLALEWFLLEYTDMRPENIMLARRDDYVQVSLATRTDQANAFNAHFFYSIHSDASSSPAANTTLFLYGGRRLAAGQPAIEKLPEGGKKFGDFLNDDLTSVMRVNRNGRFEPVGRRGNINDLIFYNAPLTRTIPWLHVNRESRMASNLSEAGFHTNSEQNMQKMNYEWKRLEAYAAFQSMVRFLTSQFGTAGAQEPPQIGIATGFVFDNETNRPINAATITLTEEVEGGDDLVKTYITDSFESLFHRFYNVTRDRELLRNGFWWIEGFTPGATLTAKIEAEGFETIETTVTIPLTVGARTLDGLGVLDAPMLNLMPARVVNVTARRDLSDNVIQRYPMTVAFDRRMVRASVEQAFSIYPAANVPLVWINDFTFQLNISELEFQTDYTITIDGTIARNTVTNDLLDGTGDGTPGGNFVFNLRTADLDEAPPVIVSYDPRGDQEEVRRPIVRIEFNEPLNEASTAGKITVTDLYGREVEGVQTYHVTTNFKSVLHFTFVEDLIPQTEYTVTLLAGIADLHGNTRTEDTTFVFTARPRDNNIAMMESFAGPPNAAPRDWRNGGQVAGLNTGASSTAFDPNVRIMPESPGSLRHIYQWNDGAETGQWRFNDFRGAANANVVQFTRENYGYVQFYLFGDGSGTRFTPVLQRVPADPNTFFGRPVAMDWVGWKLVTWDLSQTEGLSYPFLGGSGPLPTTNMRMISTYTQNAEPMPTGVMTQSRFWVSSIQAVQFGDFIERADYTINFSVTGENGALTAEDEIAGAITTGSQVLQGRNVIFTATPNEDYQVKHWTVNDTVVAGATGTTLTLRPTENTTVTVEFEEIPIQVTHTLTFSVAGNNGTLTAEVDGEAITSGAELEEGVDVVFTATPNEGFQVKEWTLNGAVVADETENTFTLENLTADAAVTVEFEQTAGIDDIFTVIQIFPNPFTDAIQITGAENSVLQITNVLGAVVSTHQITEANASIHLGELAAGIYFFRIERDGQTKTMKVVKR